MNVVHLGTFGQPRESNLSGLSEALATGIQLRNQRAEVGLKRDTLKATVQQNSIENKRAQEKLDLDKATSEFDKASKNREYGLKLVEQYSTKVSSLDDTMKGIFENSPEGKQIQKVIKNVAPEFINEETGKVIVMPPERIILNKMDVIAGRIQEKMVADPKSLSEGEKNFLDYYSKDKTALAQTYKAVQEDGRFLKAQAEGDTATMQRVVDEYRGTFSNRRGGQYTEAIAADPNDPGGFFQQ